MATYDSIKYKSQVITNLNDTGTEGSKVAVGTTAQRGSTTGQFRFNSTTGKFEGKDAGSFTVLEPSPVVSSIDVTEVDSGAGGNQTFVITGGNFSTGDIASFVGDDSTEVTAATTTINSATQITAVITKVSFVNAKEPYDVKITKSSGTTGTLTNQINVDSAPTWTTVAGSLGSVSESATGDHFTLVAADAEGDTVAYTETGGTNITGAGLALNSSTGVISGDPTDVDDDTTVSFSGRATAGGKTADRSFSFLVVNPKLYIGSTGTTFVTPGTTATKSTYGYETVTVNSDMSVYVDLWGAGGGGSISPADEARGGAGGNASGQITLLEGTTYVILVGKAGVPGDVDIIFPDNGLIDDDATNVGAGGGSTRFGLYTQSGFNLTNTASDYNNTSAIYQLIAGGGGGGSIYSGQSGTPLSYGGGTTGGDGGGYYYDDTSASPGLKGTQTAGGAGGTGGRGPSGSAGAKYEGGEGNGGAGGGGYYGGGGGAGFYSNGGGGSGFLNTGGGLLTNTGFEIAITDSANYYTAPDGTRSNRPTNAGNAGYSGSSTAGHGNDGAIVFTLV